jgi:hypothetical protein
LFSTDNELKKEFFFFKFVFQELRFQKFSCSSIDFRTEMSPSTSQKNRSGSIGVDDSNKLLTSTENDISRPRTMSTENDVGRQRTMSTDTDGGRQLLSTLEMEGRQQRSNSATSFASTLSLNGDFCKICHCGGEPNTPLITPCFCSGSLKHVHQVTILKRLSFVCTIHRCTVVGSSD